MRLRASPARAAKNEVVNYRRMGLKDDELGFVMDGAAEWVDNRQVHFTRYRRIDY